MYSVKLINTYILRKGCRGAAFFVEENYTFYQTCGYFQEKCTDSDCKDRVNY